MPTTNARPLDTSKWCGHSYSFSQRVFPQDPQTHVWLYLGRDRPLPLREAPQNSPSKVRLTWTGPKGVLKRAPRGMIATALSIWSMMDTKRVSSLIWTWGDRRQAILPGCCAHWPLVQGPLNHHSVEAMSMENHAGQDLCFLLSIFSFFFFKLVRHASDAIFKTTKIISLSYSIPGPPIALNWGQPQLMVSYIHF